jgi:hypothetical protein
MDISNAATNAEEPIEDVAQMLHLILCKNIDAILRAFLMNKAFEGPTGSLELNSATQTLWISRFGDYIGFEEPDYSKVFTITSNKEDAMVYALLRFLAFSVEQSERPYNELPPRDRPVSGNVGSELLQANPPLTPGRTEWILLPSYSSEPDNTAQVIITADDVNSMTLTVTSDCGVFEIEFSPASPNPLAYYVFYKFLDMFGK